MAVIPAMKLGVARYLIIVCLRFGQLTIIVPILSEILKSHQNLTIEDFAALLRWFLDGDGIPFADALRASCRAQPR
jgi:hypothetical protein